MPTFSSYIEVRNALELEDALWEMVSDYQNGNNSSLLVFVLTT
jgi:hypothetical protein